MPAFVVARMLASIDNQSRKSSGSRASTGIIVSGAVVHVVAAVDLIAVPVFCMEEAAAGGFFR